MSYDTNLKVCFTIANSEESTAEHRFIQEKTVAFLQDYFFFPSTCTRTQVLRPWKHRIPSTWGNPDSNTETSSSNKVKYAVTNVTTIQPSAETHS